MKFVMSYSCGKDSALALYKLKQQGHEPVALLMMVREDMDRVWFHGVDAPMREAIANCLGLPLIACPCKGEDYAEALEQGLRRAKALGAEAAAFGDIDIEGHRVWSTDRCRKVGLEARFPLWQLPRREAVRQNMEAGFTCLFKTVNTKLLPASLLGKPVCSETVAIMESCGVDPCGENGEYHTLAVDGPTFRHPLSYRAGEVLSFGDFSAIDLSVR